MLMLLVVVLALLFLLQDPLIILCGSKAIVISRTRGPSLLGEPSANGVQWYYYPETGGSYFYAGADWGEWHQYIEIQ